MKRLTPAAVTFLMFGVVGLLVAAYVGKSLFATEAPKPPRTRDVPMPIADIPAGTLVTAKHLGQGPWLASELTSDMLLRNEVVIGRYTKKALIRAQPISGQDLLEHGVTPALNVGSGLRAITLEVGTAQAIVDALIKPGDFVDIHFQPSNSTDRRFRGGVVLTLLKGIKVLAINRQFRQGQPEQSNTLTLECTPQEASVVDLAKAHGALSFRYNPEGKGTNVLAFKDPSRITLEEILGMPEIVDPKPETPFRSHLYRKTSHNEMEFFQDGRAREVRSDFQTPPNRVEEPQNPPQQVDPATE